MTQRLGVAVTTWGVLSMLAGALMTEGGVMEVIAYWPQGQTSNVVVGALGAVASAILLMSGAAFCIGRSFGRQTAIAGAIGMAPIHLVGWILGFVGVPGALVGVAYPTLLLLALESQAESWHADEHRSSPGSQRLPPPPSHSKQRTALSAA